MRAPQRLKKRKRIIRLVALLLFIVGIVFLFSKTAKRSQDIKTRIALTVPTVILQPSPTPFVNSPGLQHAIESALTGTHGTYGIVVKNLKTNETYFAHQTHIFKAGSLYKLWVMATAMELIQEGKLHENDGISQSVVELNQRFHIDPKLAEKKDGKVSFSIQEGLYQMITISDNYAGLLLAEKVTLPAISEFLKTHGLLQSKVGINGKDPVTTPLDIALFFEKLYRGQLANSMYTDKMIALLKGQKLNEKLPKYLPDDVTVAHKTGELDNFTHDGGIVYAPGGVYILVILSESDARDLAEERIATVSQAVFNYFTKGQ